MVNHRSKTKGFTLMELILVIGLMGLISSTLYSMNLFGIKTYARGGSRSTAQYEARMASYKITKEIRYSSGVSILSNAAAVPASITDDFCYIYIKNTSGSTEIVKKDKNGESIIASFSTATLSFSTSSGKVLSYSIAGSVKNESFSLGSDVMPLNINDSIITGSGTAIKYTKAVSVSTSLLQFLNAPANVYRNSAYSFTFNVSGGTAPYSYVLESGTLPSGMSISSAGVLSGTPDTNEIYSFRIRVTDSSSPNLSQSKSFKMIVGEPGLTAAMVAQKISNGIIAFPDPVLGATAITLPTVPAGFIVSIAVSSNTDVVSMTGSITKPASDTMVQLTLRVENIIDGSDSPANTTAISKMIFSGSAAQVKPVAQDVDITLLNGNPVTSIAVGTPVKVKYTYYDANGDLEAGTSIQWYVKNNNSDTLVGTSNQYTPDNNDKNKELYVKVTPKAATGLSPGDTIITTSVSINN